MTKSKCGVSFTNSLLRFRKINTISYSKLTKARREVWILLQDLRDKISGFEEENSKLHEKNSELEQMNSKLEEMIELILARLAETDEKANQRVGSQIGKNGTWWVNLKLIESDNRDLNQCQNFLELYSRNTKKAWMRPVYIHI